MIKCKQGNAKLKGKVIDIRTELTVLLRAVRKAFIESGIPTDVADSMINAAVRISRFTDEEISAEALKAVAAIVEEEAEDNA